MYATPYLFLLSALVELAFAQQTEAFTDPQSGISFQRFFGARTQFSFGIALPENPSTDFIGQLAFPTPAGSGWGGVSFTGDMVGPLLLAVWPSGNTVMSSFRIADDEDESPPQARGSFSLLPIPQGTRVEGENMVFTFLCQGCIDGRLGFGAGNTLGNVGMGWGLASRRVSNPADPATELPFHNSGFGEFTAQLSLARNTQFGEWALLAGIASNGSTTPVIPTPGNSGNIGGGGNGNDDDEEEDENENEDESGRSNGGSEDNESDGDDDD